MPNSIFVETYDTTLRDGTQSEGVSLSIEDKLKIISKLDDLGVTYIEAGYPASNEKDAEVFQRVKQLTLQNSKIVAFSMTCKKDSLPQDDPAIQTLVDCGAHIVALVGKSAALHVEKTLGTTLEENLRMISDTISYLSKMGREVFFDAEHFFDGYKENKDYSTEVLLTAARAGAKRVVLCDTNGSTMPHEISEIIKEVIAVFDRDSDCANCKVSIHAHDDCGLAVANSLAAIRAGAVQIQGTVNGYGERVGNADIISTIANLELKMGFATIGKKNCKKLTHTAHFVADVFNRSLPPNRPFVGSSAFAHKGGLHVSALRKLEGAYEHVNPTDVGNMSHVVVSELSGKASILAKCQEFGIDPTDALDAKELLNLVKNMESKGYSFELADASLELMFRRALGQDISIFKLESYRVITDRREDSEALTEATIKIHVGDDRFIATGEGNGPVNALDVALRQAITKFYPEVQDISLTDFKVRVLDESSGTDAITRVIIESRCGSKSWVTIGVDGNIIEASWKALVDSLAYGLRIL